MEGKGQFELLMADIEQEVSNAEGGWWIEDGRLVIHQQVSRDPSRNQNGGEYDYYKSYIPDGLGIEVREEWSCTIAPRSEYGGNGVYYDCVISPDGLKRMAQLADVTIAARAWLAKQPGCMARLKQAIRSLDN